MGLSDEMFLPGQGPKKLNPSNQEPRWMLSSPGEVWAKAPLVPDVVENDSRCVEEQAQSKSTLYVICSSG